MAMVVVVPRKEDVQIWGPKEPSTGAQLQAYNSVHIIRKPT
jgi:hypothetical protein